MQIYDRHWGHKGNLTKNNSGIFFTFLFLDTKLIDLWPFRLETIYPTLEIKVWNHLSYIELVYQMAWIHKTDSISKYWNFIMLYKNTNLWLVLSLNIINWSFLSLFTNYRMNWFMYLSKLSEENNFSTNDKRSMEFK